ncbi:MAG: LpxI family protein, partial [Nitrospirae bacterium]
MTKTIAVIAGQGDLPILIAHEAKKMGYRVVFVALKPLQDRSPEGVEHVEYVGVGKFGKLLKVLRSNSVEEIVMAGKVPKTLMYKTKVVPDRRALKLLMSLKDRKDDTIMTVVTEELQSEGFTVRNTTDFAGELLVKKGIYTKRKPTKDELKDIAFGFRIAKEIGRLDIGQTVVVKSLAVMAVEAIEGTDEAILRGGRLAGDGAVVVKVSKPQQDMRFDVPTVGMKTLQSMLQSKARVLALEAGNTIV